jgi:transcriptional regulator with XRE-family HTH domain
MLEEDIDIGNKIRQYRITKHHSQEELGNSINVNKQAVSRIENGIRRVSHSELVKIAEFLEEPIEVFTEREVKFKLILIKKANTAIPKFSIDFLNDFETFIDQKELTAEAARAISDEIKTRMNNMFRRRFKLLDRIT